MNQKENIDQKPSIPQKKFPHILPPVFSALFGALSGSVMNTLYEPVGIGYPYSAQIAGGEVFSEPKFLNIFLMLLPPFLYGSFLGIRVKEKNWASKNKFKLILANLFLFLGMALISIITFVMGYSITRNTQEWLGGPVGYGVYDKYKDKNFFLEIVHKKLKQ